MNPNDKPHLRWLEIQPYWHEGQQLWLFADPLNLSERQLLLPPILAQFAVFLDGNRTLAQAQALLQKEAGITLPEEVLAELLAALDGSFLLQNENTAVALQQRQQKFRAQPFRAPLIAGQGYAPNPAALRRELDEYGAEDDPAALAEWAGWHGRAIVSPHIDYQRGGNVYAQVWQRAATAVQNADLILIFATDHRGGSASVTLTPLPYATPYGILPTDTVLVDKLAQAIGEEHAYALELNHEREHSVELVAVWLHHVLAGKKPPPVVPLLLGSFHHFLQQDGHPQEDARLLALRQTLLRETAGKQVLCVASVDLAHVGPAFEDEYLMDEGRRVALVQADEGLITAVVNGDHESFYQQIATIQDANKVCGFSPLYLMLDYLHHRDPAQPIRGHKIAYQHCPADPDDDSLVSICGLLLD
jgi:MEMO1 family protein